MAGQSPGETLKDFRDQATGKVVTAVAAVATDPVGTARGLATAGAKSALRLPVRAGLAASGPALGVLTRGLALAGTALRTGRQVRERIRPTREQAAPVPAPPSPPAPKRRPAAARPEPAVDAAVAPVAAAPPEAAVLAGAPGTADAAVARAERAVGHTVTDGASLSHEELPLADYDHLTLPALRARLTRIDLTGLIQLRDYEKAHANRLPVVTMLENRIAKVTASNGN
jgi:hypothetical protein